MSETVHYKGTITEVKERDTVNLEGVAKEILDERCLEISTYHDNAVECLCDTLYDEYFFYPTNGKLYSITKTEHDLEEEIITASNRADGRIDYELRYYNGGAGFAECLEEALNKLES